jgi:hypothetical protein
MVFAPWRACRARQDVADRSTRPDWLATRISQWEEGLIVEQRRCLALHASILGRLDGRGLS